MAVPGSIQALIAAFLLLVSDCKPFLAVCTYSLLQWHSVQYGVYSSGILRQKQWVSDLSGRAEAGPHFILSNLFDLGPCRISIHHHRPERGIHVSGGSHFLISLRSVWKGVC